MPYIKREQRGGWDKISKSVCKRLESIPLEEKDGQLNYLVTKILKGVYSPKYFNYNRAIGLLECIKQEFYRRDVTRYEGKKIKENGDVA
jgi:hypothetical protein